MSVYDRPMYYRRDGSPIWYGNTEADLHQATFEWGRLMEGDRRIGDTTLPNGYTGVDRLVRTRPSVRV
jgi:hypothetical protein